MIKLIALDIDGTLLSSEYKILESTIKAIEDVKSKGIEVVLCSGRSLIEMKSLIDNFPYVNYVVCGNGSSVYEVASEQCLFANTIDYNIILDVKKSLIDIDHMFEYYNEGKIYAEAQSNERLIAFGLEKFINFLNETRVIVDNVIEKIADDKRDVEKVNINFATKSHQQLAFEKLKHIDALMTSSFQNNIEITSKNVHKLSGLQFLAKHLNIPLSEMMAIGDSGNDFEMVAGVGYGVAMGNAKENIKAVAKFITTSNDDDGIAKAIHAYIK